jgi:hypothetical protein
MILVLHIGESYQSFVISSDPFLFVILVAAWAPCDEHCGVGRAYWDKWEKDTFLYYSNAIVFYYLERQNIGTCTYTQKTKQQLYNYWTLYERYRTLMEPYERDTEPQRYSPGNVESCNGLNLKGTVKKDLLTTFFSLNNSSWPWKTYLAAIEFVLIIVVIQTWNLENRLSSVNDVGGKI